MKKIKSLRQAQKFLKDIPNIHEGGCGISALSLYRWLKKNGDKNDIKFVFLYRDDDEEEYLNNSGVLKNKKGEPVAPCHCCILHKKKFIDSEGEVDIEDYEWVQQIKEEDFLKRALDNVGTWNSTFDRGEIKKIEEGLGIGLEDIRGLEEID